MTVEIPRDVRRRLPDDLPPEAVTACLSLTGGLSEAHVIATDERLLGFVKRSALSGLEAIELDRSRPPKVAVVNWQASLVLEAVDGTTTPVPLPSMDKPRTRAGIAAIYTALGADEALRDLYLGALEETRGRSERLTLLTTLGEICERIDPPSALPHWQAVIDLDPRNQTAVEHLEWLYGAGFTDAAGPLETAHRARGDWARVVALEVDRARRADDPDARVARWLAVADLSVRRLDEQSVAIEALGEALAVGFDPTLFDRLDRLIPASRAWQAGVAALVRATEGPDAPVADLWRRVAQIRGERLDDAAGTIAAWEQVHAADPAAEDALMALADVHRAAERWGPFLYTSRRALKLTDDLGERIRLLRGIAEVEQGPCERREAAIEAWEALLEVAVYDPAALDSLETLYTETERWSDLVDLLERRQKVAEAAIDDVRAVELLCRRARLVEEKLDDVDGSIRLWREVLTRAPVPHDAGVEAELRLDGLLIRAELWGALEALLATRAGRMSPCAARGELHRRRAHLFGEQLADDEKAITAWRAVLLDVPGDREALDVLVVLYRAQDRKEDLIGTLRSLVTVLPADSPLRVDAWAELGRTLPEAGHSLEECIEAWRNVLAGDADHQEGTDALIGLYQSADRVVDAIPLLKKKASLTGALADMLLLGKLMVAVNAVDGAAEVYVRALSSREDCAPARDFLERYYTERARWNALVELLQGTTKLITEPSRQLDVVLRIADIRLTQQQDPEAALDALSHAPTVCFREKRLTDAALRAAKAGGDWRHFLADVEARSKGEDDGGTRMDSARRFAGGMLSVVRSDPEKACQLAAWFEQHDAPDRAVECYDAALAVDRKNVQAWDGKRRALARSRRWRMLSQHLEEMAQAPLQLGDRVDALRHKAQVLTRHINAPDEAIDAAKRAASLARPTLRYVLWGVVALLTAVTLGFVGFMSA